MRVSRQSYGGRLKNSIIGVFIGIILFLGSFVVLYINEGRENLADIAENATDLQQESDVADGSLVYLQGSLDADSYASDKYLADDDYIVINRNVEMYAYVEHEHKETEEEMGGSSRTITTYTYEKKWTNNPKPSTSFQGDENELPNVPEGYNEWINEKPFSGNSKASGISIDEYEVDNDVNISGKKDLSLNDENVDLSEFEGSFLSDNMIYKSNQDNTNTANPVIGDIKITFDVVDTGDNGIIFGNKNGDTLVEFQTPKGNEFLRFFTEADSKDEAVSLMQKEHTIMTWVLRLVGFLLMFVGLMAMTGPLTTFLSVIPLFSRISGFVFAVIAFIVSLVLTTLTVLLSIVLHSFWTAMAVVGAIIVITLIILVAKRKKAKA